MWQKQNQTNVVRQTNHKKQITSFTHHKSKIKTQTISPAKKIFVSQRHNTSRDSGSWPPLQIKNSSLDRAFHDVHLSPMSPSVLPPICPLPPFVVSLQSCPPQSPVHFSPLAPSVLLISPSVLSRCVLSIFDPCPLLSCPHLSPAPLWLVTLCLVHVSPLPQFVLSTWILQDPPKSLHAGSPPDPLKIPSVVPSMPPQIPSGCGTRLKN